MMVKLRRILHSGRGFGRVIAASAGCLLLLATLPTAQACWQNITTQCFNGTLPGWVTSSNQTVRWGIENIYYDTHMCQNDIRAAWACGYPPTRCWVARTARVPASESR